MLKGKEAAGEQRRAGPLHSGDHLEDASKTLHRREQTRLPQSSVHSHGLGKQAYRDPAPKIFFVHSRVHIK